MPANTENSAAATGLEKVGFHSNPKEGQCQRMLKPQRRAMPKNAQTITQLHSFHMLPKLCSKFSKLGFNSLWTVKFQMFQLCLEKAEEPEIKLPATFGSYKKQENPENIYFGFIDYIKAFDCLDHNKLKFLKRWEYQTTWPASWEIVYKSRSNS